MALWRPRIKPGPAHQIRLNPQGRLSRGLWSCILFENAASLGAGTRDYAAPARRLVSEPGITAQPVSTISPWGGSALSFSTDDNSGYLGLATATLAVPTTISCSFLAKFNGTNGGGRTFEVTPFYDPFVGANNFYVDQTTNQFTDNDANEFFTPAVTAFTTWTRLTITFDGTTARLYANGAFQSSAAFTLGFAPTRICGNWPWPMADFFFWFNRTLTPGEVAAHFADPYGTTLMPPRRPRVGVNVLLSPPTGALTVAGFAPTVNAGTTITAPSRTRALTNILGMNTHISLGSSKYSTTAYVADLTYMGVKVIRDHVTSPFNTKFLDIAAAGIKLDFAVLNTSTQVTADNLAAFKSAVTNLGLSNIVAFEQQNDPSQSLPTYNGVTTTSTVTGEFSSEFSNEFIVTGPGFLPVAHFAADLYVALKSDSSTAPVPIWHVSVPGAEPNNVGLQWLTIPGSYTAGLMPIGTIYADTLNLHSYPLGFGQGEFNDSVTGTSAFDKELTDEFVNTFNAHFSGYANVATAAALPKVITEAGFQTGTTGASAANVTATIQARNILTGWLQARRQGYQYYFVYEAYDDLGALYGMFSAVGTPKASATYLHNFSTILADSGATAETFTPVAATVTVSGLPSPGGRAELFQKSDGSYWLAIWNEVRNWNFATGAAITVGSTNVIITFASSGAINVYDPTVGTAAAATSIGLSVTVGLTDFPKLISFSNPAATAPAAGALTITGFAPGVARSVVPASAAMVIAGFVPVPTLGIGGQIFITGFAPTPNLSIPPPVIVPGTVPEVVVPEVVVGSQLDFLARLKAVLPHQWFPDTTSILDAVLIGCAAAWVTCYDLLGYVRTQTRIATATGVFLDLMARDYFGGRLRRFVREPDAHFSARIRASLLPERGTRAGVSAAVEALVGEAPIIFEPANTGDTGAWGGGNQPVWRGLAYGQAGGWGSLAVPFQAFISTSRARNSGIAKVAGYGTPAGGYGVGAIEWTTPDMISGIVPDDVIFQTIADAAPAGTIMWTRLGGAAAGLWDGFLWDSGVVWQ